MTTSVPSTLIAGDTWSWTVEIADYPAPTWTATVYFEKSDATFSTQATASGSDHAFGVTAATSAEKKAGRYKWHIRVSDGTSSYTVEEGWTEIVANPAAAGSRDRRSWARRALEAIEAQIEGRASDAQQSMTIRDRSLSRYTLKELTDLHTWLKAKVATEESANAGGDRRIGVRFSRG